MLFSFSIAFRALDLLRKPGLACALGNEFSWVKKGSRIPGHQPSLDSVEPGFRM